MEVLGCKKHLEMIGQLGRVIRAALGHSVGVFCAQHTAMGNDEIKRYEYKVGIRLATSAPINSTK